MTSSTGRRSWMINSPIWWQKSTVWSHSRPEWRKLWRPQLSHCTLPSNAYSTGKLSLLPKQCLLNRCHISSFLGQKHISLLLSVCSSFYEPTFINYPCSNPSYFLHVTEYNPNITCLASEFIVIKLTGTWHKNHVISTDMKLQWSLYIVFLGRREPPLIWSMMMYRSNWSRK